RRRPRRHRPRRGRAESGAASPASVAAPRLSLLWRGKVRRGEPPQGRAHVEEHQRGEGEAVGNGDRGEAGIADGEDLTLLGGDVDLLDRDVLGPVGGSEESGGVLAP